MTNFRFFFFDALGTAKASATDVQASESDAIAEAGAAAGMAGMNDHDGD